MASSIPVKFTQLNNNLRVALIVLPFENLVKIEVRPHISILVVPLLPLFECYVYLSYSLLIVSLISIISQICTWYWCDRIDSLNMQ